MKRKLIHVNDKAVLGEKAALNKDTITSTNKSIYIFISILIICVVIIYFNSSFGQFCMDDLMMITNNSFTKNGISSIPDILTTDFLHGYRGSESNDAASSRWRPLALITHAMEYEWYGLNPMVAHINNIILYVLLIVSIFYFWATYIFKNNLIGFLIALIFAVHPIHTEVVANIKSRDEILCLLFLHIGLIFYWQYLLKKNLVVMLLALLSIFISLLAKESSITFLVIIPLLLYFFNEYSIKKSLLFTVPVLITILIWGLIRNSIVPFSAAQQSTELLNNPFLLATSSQKFATKIYLLFYYLQKCVWPYPLCAEYSYNTFPYVSIQESKFYLSAFILIVLGFVSLFYTNKKTVFSFCILFFFISISPSTNLIIEIGTPFGERLLFLPSLALAIGLGYYIHHFYFNKNKYLTKVIASAFLISILIISSFLVICRNLDWKNDNTIFLADYTKAPNNLRMCNGAGGAYITLSYDTLRSAKQRDSLAKCSIRILTHGLSIYKSYNDLNLNLGLAYTRVDSLKKAEQLWLDVKKHEPFHPKLKEYFPVLAVLYHIKGNNYQNKFDSSIVCFKKAIMYDSTKSIYYYDLGGASFMTKNYVASKMALQKCLSLDPNNEKAKLGLAECNRILLQ
jgi:hypothetical protein